MIDERSLADRIKGSKQPPGEVSLWWLGQAGFVLRGASAAVAVDPFLTDFGELGRAYPPPFRPQELNFIDVLLATHAHVDHLDPQGFPSIFAASQGATAIVPSPICDQVEALGVDRSRLVGAEEGSSIEIAGVTIDPFAALHADQPEDDYGFHRDDSGRCPYLGYVIEMDGVRIAHTGDTLVYDGLSDRLRDADVDVLLLPINGRSWFREQRGLVGNMSLIEAAELAEAAAVRLAVPMHWDMFLDNTEDPHQFATWAARHHPNLIVEIPERGRAIVVKPRQG